MEMECVCANCDRIVESDAVKYLLSDLDSEVLAWVEENLRNEVTENSFLCGECFEGLTMKIWSEMQEPEVLHLEGMEVEGPDPLSEVDVKIQDIEVKEELAEEQGIEDLLIPIEYEPDSEKDLKKSSSPNGNKNESRCDNDVEMSNLNLEHKGDSSDESDDWTLNESQVKDKEPPVLDESKSPTSEKSLESDESWVPNKSQTKDKEPPVLDGSKLPARTKCDACNTVITKQPYQLLPEGLEKIIISTEGKRDKSPERVCCPCWNRVHSQAKHTLKKGNTTVTQGTSAEADVESNEYVKIPGYTYLPNTSSRCLVQNCKYKDKRRIPNYLRKVLFIDYNIYVKENSRICQDHRKEFNIDWDFLKKQPNNKVLFKAKDVESMLDYLRDEALRLPE